MKKVNFIEAVEYAKRGKEVYFETNQMTMYLVYQKFKFAHNIFIVSKLDYKKHKEGKEIFSTDSYNCIEFYLNKWNVKDE